MCQSMVDIQSATAEIRRGKKEETGQNIMSASATQGGHKKEETTGRKYNGLPYYTGRP